MSNGNMINDPYYIRLLKYADSQIKSCLPRHIPNLFVDFPIDLFGLLLLNIPDDYPNLKRYFPLMPSEEVQQQWTGNCGMSLLSQSCAFIKSMVHAWQYHVGRDLISASVLDYGCGWGRLTRLMYKYVPHDNIYAIDPWDISITLCREYGLLGHLAISDYMPRSLPVRGKKFDLIFAFSVFTHLSKKCHEMVLSTLRRYIANDGLLIITVRPVSYWDFHANFPVGLDAKKMMECHVHDGFAFIPHNRLPIEGDITYGDASMSLDYIANNWQDWRLVGTDCNSVDSQQLIVYLRPQLGDRIPLQRRLWAGFQPKLSV